MDFVEIKRSIISVTNKSGVVDLARFLAGNNVEIVSTGGTKKTLEQAGLPVTAVSAVTGFPEILGGRVKTLHPHIHAGILASKDDPAHLETIASLEIRPFDLVCVNLYDFSSASEAGLPLKELVEEIDIGGPCLLRAAAKNFHSVLVLPDPRWYQTAVEELKEHDMRAGLEFRQLMACRAFDATSRYDALISSCLRP